MKTLLYLVGLILTTSLCQGQGFGNKKYWACEVIKNIPEVMDTISKDGRISLFYSDSCAFPLLDSIYIRCLSDKKYLVYLDSICEISDGYLSEDIDGRNTDLLFRHFDVFSLIWFRDICLKCIS